MRYSYNKRVSSTAQKIKSLNKRFANLTIAAAFAVTSLGGSLPLLLSNTAYATSGPTTYYVDNSGDDNSSCGPNAMPCKTIQYALDQAASDDNVVVKSGTYTPTSTIQIKKNVNLRSQSGATVTTIDGSGLGQVIEVRSQDNHLTDVTIKGFALEGGTGSVINVSSDGNTDYDFKGNLLLKNLTINANGAPAGLGLFDTEGAKIQSVTVNDAKYGIEAIGVKDLLVSGSTFSTNSLYGAHIWHTAGYANNRDITVTDSTFTSNSTGIYVEDASDVTLRRNDISGGSSGIVLAKIYSAGGSVIKGSISNLYSVGNNIAGVEITGSAHDITVDGVNFNNISSDAQTAQAILVGDTGSSGNLSNITIKRNTMNNIEGGRGAYGLMVNRRTLNLVVSNNTISNISGAAWMAGLGLDAQTPNAQLYRNTFSDFSAGNNPEVAINVNGVPGSGTNTVDASTLDVFQNNFLLPNDQIGVAVTTGHGQLNAAKNYWNDSYGPSGETGSNGTQAFGNISTHSPWLCHPYPSTQTSVDGICDVDAPTIDNLLLNGNTPKVHPSANRESFTPSNVDFVNGMVTISADITDGGSGIAKVYNSKVMALTSNGNTHSDVYKQGFTLANVGGNTWTGTFDTTYVPNDGLYQVFFNTKDKVGNVSSARINIYVDNTVPSVDAGSDDQTVEGLSTSLDGTANDTNGVSVVWAQIAGPGTATFGDSNSQDTSLTVDNFGSYTFELTATDSAGNTASDTVEITFNQQPEENGDNTGEDQPTQPNQPPQQRLAPNNQQVLGVSSINDTNNNDGEANDGNGEVKGEETTNLDVNNTEKQANTTSASNSFLALGWWWVPILAALLFFFFALFRRAGTNQKAS